MTSPGDYRAAINRDLVALMLRHTDAMEADGHDAEIAMRTILSALTTYLCGVAWRSGYNYETVATAVWTAWYSIDAQKAPPTHTAPKREQ